MPSLCEAPRRPASGSALSLHRSFSACRPLSPRRACRCLHPVPSRQNLPSPRAPDSSALSTRTISGLIGSPLLRPAELLASLSETFTSGLSTVRSPSPPPDITTVATEQFHRWDFHPLERQLASLHELMFFYFMLVWGLVTGTIGGCVLADRLWWRLFAKRVTGVRLGLRQGAAKIPDSEWQG
jgi:hypothetical protein